MIAYHNKPKQLTWRKSVLLDLLYIQSALMLVKMFKHLQMYGKYPALCLQIYHFALKLLKIVHRKSLKRKAKELYLTKEKNGTHKP